MNAIFEIFPQPLFKFLLSMLFYLVCIPLQAQTEPAAKPVSEGSQGTGYILQKDYDDLRRGGGRIKSEELPAMEQKAMGGDLPSQLLLGMAYQLGCGVVKKDIKTAVNWYGKAADQGSSMAETQIGVYYDIGSGHNKNEGVRWYRKAAEHHDAVAAEIH
jgi:hypothetical protein